MIEPERKPILHAFIAGRTEARDRVDFAAELASARTRFATIAPDLDGMDVSRALRAAGFRRLQVPGPLTYSRVPA